MSGDLEQACQCINQLTRGSAVKQHLERSLVQFAREIHATLISSNPRVIPLGPLGVISMLNTVVNTIKAHEDVFFLIVHFLALQNGWVVVQTEKDALTEGVKTDTTTFVAQAHHLLPPGWSNATPRNGSFATTYTDDTMNTVTLSCLRVDKQILVHLHVEKSTEALSAEFSLPDVASDVNDLTFHSIDTIHNVLRRSLFSSSTKKRRSTTNKKSKESNESHNTSPTQKQKPSSDQHDMDVDRPSNPLSNQRPNLMVPNRGDVRPGSFGFDQDLHPSFGGGMGGGMGGGGLVGPSHPGFGLPQRGGFPGAPGGLPGARFDPFGPGVPGQGGRGGGRGGGGGNRNMGGPTPDHLAPPDMGDRPDWMYQ